MTDRVREAAQELCNFAFSSLTADCKEARDYLNSLVSNLRDALTSPPKGEEEIAKMVDPVAFNIVPKLYGLNPEYVATAERRISDGSAPLLAATA